MSPFEENLIRVESAVTATSSGNLTWERWPHDVATALGFAGRSNPLGFAVIRYLSDEPSSAAVWSVVLLLATELIKRGCDKGEANQIAWDAFSYWRDARCPACSGRGVADAHQRICKRCDGSGRKRAPDSPEMLKSAISALIEAEQWMEGQLAARLRSGG